MKQKIPKPTRTFDQHGKVIGHSITLTIDARPVIDGIERIRKGLVDAVEHDILEGTAQTHERPIGLVQQTTCLHNAPIVFNRCSRCGHQFERKP